MYPRVHGLPAIPLRIDQTAADLPIIGRECILRGVALVESTGAAVARFDLVTGGDVNGDVVVPVVLAIGAALVLSLPGDGVLCRSGLFLHRLAGTVNGTVWVFIPGVHDQHDEHLERTGEARRP